MGISLIKFKKFYNESSCKIILLTLLLTVTGTIGTLLMYFVENKYFGGVSFFGAVFLVPIAFLFLARLVKMSYKDVMDFCAVGECTMLALMKLHCIMSGCCLGRVLVEQPEGIVIRFPSRIMEMLVAIILFIIFYNWKKNGRRKGLLYPWYMVLYGCARFGLNISREVWVETDMWMPYGNIWSMVSIAIGCLWLALVHKSNICLENEKTSK